MTPFVFVPACTFLARWLVREAGARVHRLGAAAARAVRAWVRHLAAPKEVFAIFLSCSLESRGDRSRRKTRVRISSLSLRTNLKKRDLADAARRIDSRLSASNAIDQLELNFGQHAALPVEEYS